MLTIAANGRVVSEKKVGGEQLKVVIEPFKTFKGAEKIEFVIPENLVQATLHIKGYCAPPNKPPQEDEFYLMNGNGEKFFGRPVSSDRKN